MLQLDQFVLAFDNRFLAIEQQLEARDVPAAVPAVADVDGGILFHGPPGIRHPSQYQ